MSYEGDLATHYNGIRQKLIGSPPIAQIAPSFPRQPTSIRNELEALLLRIRALEEQNNYLKKRVTLVEIKNEWKPNLNPHNPQVFPQKQKITIDDIFQLVIAKEGVTAILLYSHQRFQKLCFARNIIYYLACQYTEKSLPQIGAFMRRDHTTILKIKNNFIERRKEDQELDAKLQWYENELVKLATVKSGAEVVDNADNVSIPLADTQSNLSAS